MRFIEALLDSIIGDAPLREVRVGPFWTAVWSRHCGLAATVLVREMEGDPPVAEAGQLQQKSARQLAQLALSQRGLERSIGVAALNSLLEPPEGDREINALDWMMERGVGKRVALVGHFPFVPRLRQRVRTLWVLEKTPLPGDLPEMASSEVIPLADILAISGSALVYGGIDELLALKRSGSLAILLGPTTPLSPLCFDFGVDILCGSRVTEPDAVLRQLAEGAIFHQVRQQGIRLCTLARPGILD
jgi:uncharacterized protein (DUF4213/DUF364 family)